MALSLRGQVSLNTSVNNVAVAMAKTFTETTTGEDYDAGSVSVTTSAAQLSLKAALGTVGFMIVYNADDTNYIRIGDWNSGTPQVWFTRVPPQRAVLIYPDLAANDIAVIADTATCLMQFVAFER